MGPGADTGGAARHAFPVTPVPHGRWLFTRPDGLMTAYAVAPHGLVRWTERTGAGETWTGPEWIEVPRWTGHPGMARTREGYVHIAARRSSAADPARQEIVVATQFQTGRALTPWHNLGAPGSAPDAGRSLAFGPLTEVNPATGSVHVLVATRTGEIYRRSRNPQGNWGGWKSVMNDPEAGEPVTVLAEGGALEVLVRGTSAADRWVGRPQGHLERVDRVPATLVPGSATAYETGPERATFFWRRPGDGSVVAWRPPSTGGEGPAELGGAGGRGAPAVTRVVMEGHDCTVLAQCAVNGGVEVAAYVTEHEEYGLWWAPTGGPDAQSVQIVLDGAGRVAVAALDTRGALHITRQKTAREGLALGRWRRVGRPARGGAWDVPPRAG
ncbi:hypothetical protein [Streptomyces sp. NPDC052042]|uniref:hypothetical protein n=1 Tax=Streptomyces sp. NPDC052042 TaxID=3365683 RepID=UPI0037D72954